MLAAIREELVMPLKCAERTPSLMVKSSYEAESQIWPIINSPLCTEPEASLVHSEETATGSYPDWDQSSSPHPHSQDFYVISFLMSVITTIISILISIIIIIIIIFHLSLRPTGFFFLQFIQLNFFSVLSITHATWPNLFTPIRFITVRVFEFFTLNVYCHPTT
jgi:hypothetical protein